MAPFWKKKKEKPEDQQNEHEKAVEKAVSGLASTQSAQVSAQQAAAKFAKPATYTGNRGLFDSPQAKISAKKDAFQSGKPVRDPYTGKKLVMTKREAKMQYGDKWTEHLAESDHIRPVKEVYGEVTSSTAKSQWTTVEDIRDAVNSEENIQVTSRKYNNAKRDRTNTEFVEDEEYLRDKGVKVTEEGKRAAVRDDKAAKKAVDSKLRKSAVKNVASTFHDAGVQGAKNAGASTLATVGIMNMVDVIRGEKDAGEAVAETVEAGGKAAVTGYAMSGGLTVVSQTLSGSSSQFIRSLVDKNVPGKVITAVMVMGDTLKRYGNGEITTQECMIELGDKGLTAITAGYFTAVGQVLIPIPVVGGAIGAFVGTAMTGKLYQDLVTELQTKQLEHQERLRLMEECDRAAEQARAYREELEGYIQAYFMDCRECFDSALSTIQGALVAGDAEGAIAGANQITRKLGGQAEYETVDEFVDFFNSDSYGTL